MFYNPFFIILIASINKIILLIYQILNKDRMKINTISVYNICSNNRSQFHTIFIEVILKIDHNSYQL
jgi:hypothetical protein